MTLLRQIPKVDKALEWPDIKCLLVLRSRPVVVRAVRAALDCLRTDVLQGKVSKDGLTEHAIVTRVTSELSAIDALSFRRVINGTGVVIHTNLGRSPLPERVSRSLADIAFGYSNLEFNLSTGGRGSRYSHVERLLCELTGAEAALVVNNNAAAVLLSLSALAQGKEVIVSRGELVEIGGSFRIPDVMSQSGAFLREVGATNRTHIQDYRVAVNDDTALLLKVHASNFAMLGFTAEVSAKELVALGREFTIPVMADVGSGNLVDLARLGVGNEPMVQVYVRAGVDLVTFSGDKLLGGPQAGIIVGRRDYIEPLKKHPLLRALRIDKLTLAALEGTLVLYRDEHQVFSEIPVLRMLTMPLAVIALKGRRMIRKLRRGVSSDVILTLMDGVSQVGGGALPLVELPTVLLAVKVTGHSTEVLEAQLRSAPVPVLGRISKDTFFLDLRTIADTDLPDLLAALRAAAA